MNFWVFISDHYAVISLIAFVWILGVLAGKKINGIKKIFIKNPFAGKKSSIIDNDPIGDDILRYKREYVINLIVNKKQELPFDDISAFTIRLDDIIDNHRLKTYTELNTKENNKDTSNTDFTEESDTPVIENNIASEMVFSKIDENDIVLLNYYANEQKGIANNDNF
jgi:hypothetical protein